MKQQELRPRAGGGAGPGADGENDEEEEDAETSKERAAQLEARRLAIAKMEQSKEQLRQRPARVAGLQLEGGGRDSVDAHLDAHHPSPGSATRMRALEQLERERKGFGASALDAQGARLPPCTPPLPLPPTRLYVLSGQTSALLPRLQLAAGREAHHI